MIPWWISQLGRLQTERNAIVELEEGSPWLLNLVWHHAKNLQLVVDFDLHIGEKVIPLTLVYPEFFPDTAPSVSPRDKVRLSGHQYGATGELCLEYRPDNWMSNVSGAMMIESAYRLLSTEQDTGQAAPSDHRLLPAQRLRGAFFRFLYSSNTLAGISMLAVGKSADAEIQAHYFADTCAAQLLSIGPADAPIWTEHRKRGHGASKLRASVARFPEGALRECKDLDELKLLLETNGFEALAADLAAETDLVGIILSDGVDLQVLMVFKNDGLLSLACCDTMHTEINGTRLDSGYERLAAAKVAVVGCGSVGSKVAVHLARSGVANFVLVDGDVLESGNLVRNELDWRAVGIHKAPALSARLKEVNADCTVASRAVVMGGQESSGTLSSVMNAIAGCDLIIDATADPAVFNLCASIARRAKKPMCWAQVFGGGAGGIVVRLRPQIDPTPLVARQRIEDFYTNEGVEWPDNGSSQPYADIDDAGMPLVADDADVSVIAAHLSRFAIDLLARPDATIFPYSAYLIGLTQKWMFSAPFDALPINLGESDVWGVDTADIDADAVGQVLADLFPKTSDEG